MKKLEEDIGNPLKGSLSMFRMNFASNGLSWAANVYQKWENTCLDNVTGQDPLKYVDAFGENFRKVCGQVAENWLNPFADASIEAPVSDFSLEQEVIDEVCKKCKANTDGSPVNNDSPLLTESEPVVSSENDFSLAPKLDVSEDASPEEACDMVNEKPSLTRFGLEEYNFSGEAGENLEEVSDPFTLFANNSNSSTSVHAISLLCPEDEAVEGVLIGPMLSGCTLSTDLNDTFTSQGGIPLVGSSEKQEEQLSTNDTENSLSVTEISTLSMELEPVISSENNLSLAPKQDASEGANPEEACDMVNKKASLTRFDPEGHNLPDEPGESLEEVSDPFTLFADNSNPSTSAHAIPLLCPEDVVERGWIDPILSSCTVSTDLNDTFMSQVIPLVGSSEKQEERPSTYDTEDSLSVTEINIFPMLNFDSEAAAEGHDSADENREPVEEFEDISLDDRWDDAELNELVSSLYQERRKMSYKEKLRYAIISRLRRTRRNYEWASTTPPSVSCKAMDPKKLSIQESDESDWEFL